MKKSDLRTGMFVKTREEDKYIVLLNTVEGDRLIDLRSGESLYLEDYDDDFNMIEDKIYDIMKIYSNDCASSSIVDITNLKNKSWYKPQQLIWERQPEKIQINVKAEIENVEEIRSMIAELEERLNSLKIKLCL
jgi:hypothetical protein